MPMIKNPDDYFVKVQKKQIKENGGYCLNKPRGIKANKCICDEYKKTGVCACGLYVHIPADMEDETYAP